VQQAWAQTGVGAVRLSLVLSAHACFVLEWITCIWRHATRRCSCHVILDMLRIRDCRRLELALVLYAWFVLYAEGIDLVWQGS
jgi:hypothetical protein